MIKRVEGKTHCSHSNRCKNPVLKYLLYFGAVGICGLTLFSFMYLKVLHIPLYNEGDTAERLVTAPIDFSISWNVHAFYSKNAFPDVFGKVYRLSDKTTSQASKEGETQLWLNKTQDFLSSAGFIDTSTYKCLQDLHLRPSSLKDRDRLFCVAVGPDVNDLVLQCIAHVANYLNEENCPIVCKEYILDTLQKSTFDIAVDKELSGYIKGDLLGTRRIEHFCKGIPIIQRYQTINGRDVKVLRHLKNQLISTTVLFATRSPFPAILAVLFVMFWGYHSLMTFCPELLGNPRRFMLFIAILSLSLIGVKIAQLFCSLGPQSWQVHFAYPLVLPFTAMLLGHLVGVPLAGASCTLLGVLYAMEFDMWNNVWFLIINLITSWSILFTLNRVTRLSSMFWCCMRLWLISLVILTVFRVFLNNASWNVFFSDCLGGGVYSLITAICVGSLVPVLESSFSACTHNHLLEYFDSDYPLLKRLFEEAPGTYQHSVLVGILSESAANAIHADGFFCRVVSQYHDIGKLFNPGFFLENHQILGKQAHELTPLECAQVIIRHIPEGVELARKYGLPDSFIRIIEEHHGTSIIFSFYHNHLKEHPKTGALDEGLFRYPGRKPSTKESTIIMIADSFEAAARSLEGTSILVLRNLIDKIVSGKMQDGQFSDSPITLDELATICDVMTKTLYSALHSRVKYPEITLQVCPE